MNIHEWIKSKSATQAYTDERSVPASSIMAGTNSQAIAEAAQAAVARALGISVRQLRRKLAPVDSTVRFVKPSPHFREALAARQKKARP